MKKSGESVERFWDRYIEQVRQKGIKEPFDRWYVIRVQEYIKANEGRRLADHRPMDVEAFLGDENRTSLLKPWQFVQVVDAIQKLFCGIVCPPWAETFDWDFWKASARRLKPDHPTLATRFLLFSNVESLEDLNPQDGSFFGS